MVRSKKEKKDINRAITVLVLGLIISLFLIFNSQERFGAGILYSLLGIGTIFGYLIWDKF